MRTKRFFGFVAIFFSCLIFFLKNPAHIFATVCSLSSSTISATCTYADSTIYLDAGTGTTNSYQLTVASGILGLTTGQTLYVGSLKLSGGSITSVGTTKIILGTSLWMVDADGDGYPASTTVYTSQPTNGKRLNTIPLANRTVPETVAGCDSLATRNPGMTGWYTTAASDSTWDYNCDGSQTLQYPTTTAYSCVASSCAAHYYVHTDGWATAGAPACGVAKNWSSFATNGSCAADTGCAGQTTVSRIQGCH